MAQGFKNKISKGRKKRPGAARKLQGRTKKGGGNGKSTERKNFKGSGHTGRAQHQAVCTFKKQRSAQVRTTIEGEMASAVLKRGEQLTLLKGLALQQGREVLPALAKRPNKKNVYRKPRAQAPKALHPLSKQAMKLAAREADA